MKKHLVTLLILMSASVLAIGQELVIAVRDFKVESANPSYTYLGKGISRLVASELRRSGKMKLVEREDMNKLIAEQELSLSDLMDQAQQVQIGKMLSAKYIVMGEIIDMGNGGVMVSVRMVSVETGEIIWQDAKQEKLAAYDYMGAYFAKSMLDPLKVTANKTTIAKVAKKEVKAPEAIIKTSEGINAYDQRNTEAARKSLEEAKALDPRNDVVTEYLAKLEVNMTKFKVLLEPYYTDQNPAYLGVIRADRIYLSNNYALEAFQSFFSAMLGGDQPALVLPNGSELTEWDARLKAGYSFPISDAFGLSIEAIFFATINDLQTSSSSFMHSPQSGAGGILSAGYKISDSTSLGLGLGVYPESNSNIMFFSSYEDKLHLAYSLNVGALFRNPDESVTFDIQAGYCTGKIGLIDPNTAILTGYTGMPLFVENTLTLAFDKKRLFIILKQLNDICLDRVYYYGRINPAIEYFFLNWLSLRLGAELAYARLGDTDSFGYGMVGGVTLRAFPRKMDIDLNASYRLRPSRVLEGIMYPEWVVTVGTSWNGILRTRGR
jgi:TolB-like protein